MNTTTDNRTAVLNAVALVSGTKNGTIPAARAMRALNTLAHTGTIEALQVAQPSMPGLVRDLVDWHGQKRATKPVIKALSTALRDIDINGNSRYSHAVELASYVSICSPLLEPDHLAELASACSNNSNAYAPLATITRTTQQLANILEPFNTRQKRALLVSLWDTAHQGRWWDATVNTAAPRRMRASDEHRAEATELCRTHTSNHDTSGLVDQMCAGIAEYTTESAHVLANYPLERELARTLAAVIRAGRRDPDVNVLASHVQNLRPLERPDNPIQAMLDILEHAIKLEDGETYADVFDSTEIEEWADLYPEASRARYQYSKEFVAATNNTDLPGVQDAKITICRSALELVANRDYMGNCTYGWNHRCIEGTAAIGIVAYLGERYNFELIANGNMWRLGQVNCRFNGANGYTTPAAIPGALSAWVNTLPR